ALCAPGTTRACGGSGQSQLCGSAGTWCDCQGYSPSTCSGSTGGWVGCRGNGCAVCSELISSYPCYTRNHPDCASNSGCGGLHFTCNAACPAPTAAATCMCMGTAGHGAGERAIG